VRRRKWGAVRHKIKTPEEGYQMQFNPKSFYEVNREERYYGFFVFSYMLQNPAASAEICKLIAGVPDSLSFNEPEVYLEATFLRDYWRDLGDPQTYTADTHGRRRAIIENCMSIHGLNPADIDKENFFWTSPKREKLWCPSEWDINLRERPELKRHKELRWAFNAKPDVALVDEKNLMFIEIKLESGEGRTEDGYNQFSTQTLIGNLATRLVPHLVGKKFKRIDLDISGADSLHWNDLMLICKGHSISKFQELVIESFMSRYYASKRQ